MTENYRACAATTRAVRAGALSRGAGGDLRGIRLPSLRGAGARCRCSAAPACTYGSDRRQSPPRPRGWGGLVMGLHPLRLLAAAVLLALGVLGGAFPTHAQTGVPADWALKPSGLSGGDQFRLLFITSTTRNAESTDIADYNTFVQGRAAAGHQAIRSHSSGFRVVGCTEAVDARDNTSTTPHRSRPSAPAGSHRERQPVPRCPHTASRSLSHLDPRRQRWVDPTESVISWPMPACSRPLLCDARTPMLKQGTTGAAALTCGCARSRRARSPRAAGCRAGWCGWTRVPQFAQRPRDPPPFRRYSVIPVPRKLWAQISPGSPALRARRLIILSALSRDIARSCSASRRPGSQLRKSGPRRSSPMPAASR